MLIVLSAIGFLLLAVAPIGPAMLLVLEQRFPRPPMLPDRIDGILVLGGAVDPRISLSYGETVFNSSVARVLAGVTLARHHPEAKLALVGGEGEFFPVGFAESRATSGFVRRRRDRSRRESSSKSGRAAPMRTPSSPRS